MSAQTVMAWTIIAGIVALAALTWYLRAYFMCQPQHAGGGEGALTVRYLAMRIEAETSSGGRHRLREPATIRGAPADEQRRTPLSLPETRAPMPDEWARDPAALHRILAGLQRC
ncbi:hypothetical protein [Saccharopolyspora hattusasensis]|uniref:hypothetical protein n=1 Tax=Saccharopolyspora hattusasensis TaxID=1128679 RepID=UPI003D99FD8C